MIAKMPEANRRKIKLHYNFTEEEKPWLFAAVDIFAYPSGFESFGIAFLEAWAVKKPVIGCRRGAIPWVVDAGRDGLLVDFQDDRMLAEALLALLHNPGWSQALGEAGYEKVRREYTWPEVARRFREVYCAARGNFA
jgi:glycosyltransferase involved in cell wall biosynthesis